jgi:hypothetical protein
MWAGAGLPIGYPVDFSFLKSSFFREDVMSAGHRKA